MDKITKEANPDSNLLNELLFADDQSLIHNSARDLQNHTTRLNAACESYGMRISIGKTETMVVGRSPRDIDITINNEKLKQTSEFKYLGSTFTSDGSINREIEVRCQKANNIIYQLNPLLTHKAIPMETKAKLINTIFFPTLCYQCQTWTLNKKNTQKVITCEMRCLRRAANVTRTIRNEVIRKMVGTTPVSDYIAKHQVRWFSHLVRMPPYQPAARTYNSLMNGTRPRGRPRKRWANGVKELLSSQNINMTQATRLAQERKLHFPTTL